MRKIFFVLLLCLSLGASANADVYAVAYVSKLKYEMWFETCDYSQYSCLGVNVPNVVMKKLRPGLYGYYDGGDTVYIRRGLMGSRLKEVLMHEFIHYLQKQKGGLVVPGPAEQICHAENEAFGMVDQWLIDNHYFWLVVGPNWWVPYTHCWKWYDPEFKNYPDWVQEIWNLDPFEDT